MDSEFIFEKFKETPDSTDCVLRIKNITTPIDIDFSCNKSIVGNLTLAFLVYSH